ncbi:hypothetical protein ACS0TY_005855 [Phlomoides rotata]
MELCELRIHAYEVVGHRISRRCNKQRVVREAGLYDGEKTSGRQSSGSATCAYERWRL